MESDGPFKPKKVSSTVSFNLHGTEIPNIPNIHSPFLKKCFLTSIAEDKHKNDDWFTKHFWPKLSSQNTRNCGVLEHNISNFSEEHAPTSPPNGSPLKRSRH